METPKNNKENWYSNDRIILVACIFLAFIFWLFVQMSQEYASSVAVNLEFELPAGFLYSTTPPDELKVQVRAEGWDLLKMALSRTEFPVQFELEPQPEQRISEMRIREKINQALVKRIKVMEGSIPGIVISLEPAEQRMIPVRAAYTAQLEPGLSLKHQPTATPDSILVSGPQTKIENLEFIYTDSVKLDMLRSPTRLSLALQQPSKEITIHQDSVAVLFPIERRLEKSFYRAVQIRNPRADSVTIFPSQVKIDAIVYMSDFDKLRPEDFEVIIDFSKIDSTNTSLPIQLINNSQYARSVRFVPEDINYFIVK